VLKSRIPGAVPEYFNNFSDQTEAVKTGKIAGFLVDEPMARDIINRTSGLASLKELLTADGYAFAFPKNQAKLQKEVNAALKEMRHSGALKEIEARWFGGDESAKFLPDFKTEGKNGVIRLATNSGMAPFAYMKHGKMAGYDIEIAMVIASKLGRTLEIVDMDIAAIIPSLITGKSDMAARGAAETQVVIPGKQALDQVVIPGKQALEKPRKRCLFNRLDMHRGRGVKAAGNSSSLVAT